MEENLALGDNIGDTTAAAAAAEAAAVGKGLLLRHFPAFPFWLGSKRSADRGAQGGQRAPEDATCNMLHSRFLEPQESQVIACD